MSRRNAASCAPATLRLKRGSQSGFLLTVELLLLLTIFGGVIYFAIAIWQERLIASIDPIGGSEIIAYDNTPGTPLGIARSKSFNLNEAPTFVYRPDAAAPSASVLGIRSDGFTTHQRVYFENPTCSGTFAWILDPTIAAAAASSAATQTYANSGGPFTWNPWDISPVSDTYTLQTIAYAMGPNQRLYRAQGSLSTFPAGTPGVGLFPPLQSEWSSERYGPDRCRNLTAAPLVAYANAIGAYVVQADTFFFVADKNGAIFQPDFFAPTSANLTPPPAMTQTSQNGFNAPINESEPLPVLTPTNPNAIPPPASESGP